MTYATSAAPKQKKRLMQSLWLNLLLVVAACGVLYFLFFASLGIITQHGNDVKVPAVAGKDISAAMKQLTEMGFDVRVDSTYEPDKKALVVLQQMPDVGELVKNGRTLFLTVNKAVPPTTPMPNLVNLSFRSAALILQSNRLVLGDTSYRHDIADGAILEQKFAGQDIRAGQSIPQGSRIDLVIGDGLGNTEMNVPDVIGMTFAEAAAMLNGSNILVTPIPDPDVVNKDSAIVYKQTPNAINDGGQPTRIREGDGIDLYTAVHPSDSLMDANRNGWKNNLKSTPPDSIK